MTKKEKMEYLILLNLGPEKLDDLVSIKNAWKSLCKEYHPDKFNLESYQKYIDTLKKANRKSEECSMEAVLSKEDMEYKFREITHAYKMLTDPAYVKAFNNTFKGSQINLDAVFNMTVDFDQAFFGDNLTITFSPVHIDDSGKPVKIDTSKDVYMKPEIIKVRIREGISSGDIIKIAKKGLSQKDRRGDMLITLQVTPHSRFTLQGIDVAATVEVPLETMLMGGIIDVPTMWGISTLRVPAGTLPQSKLTLKNKGVSKVGDHIITINPQYPCKEDLQKRKVWKKLGIDWTMEKEKDDTNAKEEQEYQAIFEQLKKAAMESD